MLETLKKIAGFFAVQLQVTYSLPEMFSLQNLRSLWDFCYIELQKKFEQAMELASDVSDIVELKRAIL